MKNKILVSIIISLFSLSLYGQNMNDTQNEVTRDLKKNFGKFNVLAGTSIGSLEFIDSYGKNLSGKRFNAIGFYVGGSTYTQISKFTKSSLALNTEYIMGKQTITATQSQDLETDSLCLFNFTEYKGYLMRVPIKLTYNRFISENAYWGISAGGHISVPMLMGTIKNETTKSEFREAKKGLYYIFEYGWLGGVEFGYRGGYIALDYTWSLQNLSDVEGTSIKDLGTFSFTLGYRFETDAGKEVSKKINSLQENM